jgi:hypothetical protein
MFLRRSANFSNNENYTGTNLFVTFYCIKDFFRSVSPSHEAFQGDWFIARALSRVGFVSEPENGVLQTSDYSRENCYFLPILNLFFYEMPD